MLFRSHRFACGDFLVASGEIEKQIDGFTELEPLKQWGSLRADTGHVLDRCMDLEVGGGIHGIRLVTPKGSAPFRGMGSLFSFWVFHR